MSNNISPKVSVIIPTYNYAYLIDQAIESILYQSYKDLELIICDDCSDDDTEEVVKKYNDPRIRFYKNETRLGLYGNFNYARQYAKGEYLLFLCADDLLSSESITFMVKALDYYPSAALAITYYKQGIDEFGNKIGKIIPKKLGPGLVKGEEVILAQCRFAGSVGRPSEVLIRANVLPLGDIFDRSVEHCADNFLWCSLCEKYDVAYVKEAIAYIRSHNKQATKYHEKILLDIKNDHEMFKRLFKNSKILIRRPFYKYLFVKNRLYPWFIRALKEIYHQEWQRGLWILKQIADFSPIPWWFPYFLWIKIIRSSKAKIKKLIYS